MPKNQTAHLILRKDQAKLDIQSDTQGVFSQVYIVNGYDSMPEQIARKVAKRMGWKITESRDMRVSPMRKRKE